MQVGQEPRPLDTVATQKSIPWQTSGADRFSQPPHDAVSPIPVVAEPGPGNTMAAFVDQVGPCRDCERSSKPATPPGPASTGAPVNNGSPMDSLGRTAPGSGPAVPQGSGFTSPGMAISAPPQSSTDQFAIIQQRLRDWGTTYYRLETWGNAGQMYRFYCKMAIAGVPAIPSIFEATASEPLQAMGKVLHDVRNLAYAALRIWSQITFRTPMYPAHSVCRWKAAHGVCRIHFHAKS